MSTTGSNRRGFLRRAGGTLAGAPVIGAPALLLPGKAQAAITVFHSPPVTPYRDTLTIPPLRSGSQDLPMAEAAHRFHSSYPSSPAWGYGGQSYHGPTVQAYQGQPLDLNFPNRLGRHALAANVDTTLHHASADDITAPRANVHLHGHLSQPQHDGHPFDTWRRGATRSYHYENKEGARHFWFHDHTAGMTRLNVAAGLSCQYLVRDVYDTGEPGNPLGLPAGEFEIPLQIQDRMFDAHGRLSYRFTPLAAADRWSGTWVGDRIVVNGTVWPRLPVARGVYRFRLLNSSSARSYRLTLRGQAPMYVIGADHGLLNAPIRVNELKIAPAERYDVLIDFRNVAPGTRIELRNTELPPLVDLVIGAMVVPQVMAFDVGSALGPVTRIPERLRGGPNQPPVIAPVPAPTLRRVMTLRQVIDFERIFPPIKMLQNNVGFDTNFVDIGRCGVTEVWDVVNTTADEHPIHVHMAASMRLVHRRRFNGVFYELFNPPPRSGQIWRPNPDPYLYGPTDRAAGYEDAPKDVIIARGFSVTRFTVTWPSAELLGFDPDQRFEAGSLVTHDPDGGSHVHSDHDHHGLIGGYVWHCHILDHEDHDMMLPIRLQR